MHGWVCFRGGHVTSSFACSAAGSGRDLQAKSTGTFEPGNAADLANDFSTSGKDTALGLPPSSCPIITPGGKMSGGKLKTCHSTLPLCLGRALELLDSTRSHMSHAPPPRTFCKMHGNALSDQVTQAGGSRGHSKAGAAAGDVNSSFALNMCSGYVSWTMHMATTTMAVLYVIPCVKSNTTYNFARKPLT